MFEHKYVYKNMSNCSVAWKWNIMPSRCAETNYLTHLKYVFKVLFFVITLRLMVLIDWIIHSIMFIYALI